MQPTGYRITIDQPCHERWADMTPVEKGRHCAACNTQVVDLSGYSDSDLARFLHGRKEPFCGRFRQHQLARTLPLPSPMTRYPVLKKWLAGALFVVASQSVAAQQNQLSPEVSVCDEPQKPRATEPDSLAADTVTSVDIQPDAKSIVADTTVLDSSSLADSAARPPEPCKRLQVFDTSMVAGNVIFKMDTYIPVEITEIYGYTNSTPFYESLPSHELGSILSALPLGRAAVSYPAPSKAPVHPVPLSPFPFRAEAILPKRARTEEEPETQNS